MKASLIIDLSFCLFVCHLISFVVAVAVEEWLCVFEGLKLTDLI